MTKARKKVSVANTGIETQEELLATVATVSRAMLAEREIKNAMDTELQLVREEYQRDLADLAAEIDINTELCAEYCASHLDMFPKDRKSIDLTHAVIGFRTGTPKVKLLKGWTWERCLDMIQSFAFQFTRTKVEVDKEAILAFAAEETDKDRLNAKVLKPIGVTIVQEPTFFIEPKLEDQPTGVKVTA